MIKSAKRLAATLATLGVVAAPAPALADDNNDLARIIAGLAFAGIVAKAIDDRRDRNAARRAARSEPHLDANRYGNGIRHQPPRTIDGTVRRYDKDALNKRPRLGKPARHVALPDRCLRQVDTVRGSRLAYGARCLDRRYPYAAQLPRQCETVVRTPRGLRTVYGARCLRRDGWRVARR